MRIGIALKPLSKAEWIELALLALPQVQICFVPEGLEAGNSSLDLLIVDDGQPGPDFISFYKRYQQQHGPVDMIVLGTPQSTLMMHLDWNPERTFFISKPYSLEVLKQSVRLKFVEYEKRSESVPEGKIVAVPFGDKPVEPREKIKLGYLSSLPLGDLLQMLCMSRWSGTVEVTELASEISGKIMIDSGDIIHALCGKDEPQAACTHMLNWGRCSFHFDETPPTVERTLRLPYQEIMLNAMRVKDELDGLAAG